MRANAIGGLSLQAGVTVSTHVQLQALFLVSQRHCMHGTGDKLEPHLHCKSAFCFLRSSSFDIVMLLRTK